MPAEFGTTMTVVVYEQHASSYLLANVGQPHTISPFLRSLSGDSHAKVVRIIGGEPSPSGRYDMEFRQVSTPHSPDNPAEGIPLPLRCQHLSSSFAIEKGRKGQFFRKLYRRQELPLPRRKSSLQL